MRRKFSLLLVVVVILTLLMSTVAYAKTNNPKAKGQQSEHLKGYERNLKNFVIIDGERIKVKGKNVKFDTPPVIKAGRTLIPVRAITEAMGGQVEWNADDFIATIISPDGLIRIDFYLKDVDEDDDGEVDVYAGTILIFDLVGDVWVQRESLAKTDVLPGLINNRTFVPLRFISETFGLKVAYDDETGEIDIDDPEEEVDVVTLTPEEVTYATMDDVEPISIAVILDAYDFDGIDGLVKGTHYTVSTTVVSDYATEPSLFIQFYESYIESLLDEETVLTIQFIKGSEELEKTFTINLDYNDLEPEISPEKAIFKGEDVVVDLILNGFELVGITLDDEDADFSGPYSDKITFDDLYLSNVLDGKEEVEFEFKFERGSMTKSISFEVEAYEYEPKINPDKVSYETIDVVPVETVIEVVTDGFGLVGIEGLDLGVHYTTTPSAVTDVTSEVSLTIQLLDTYVKGLSDEFTELELDFIKGTEEVSKTFEIELMYNHLTPTITPGAVTYTGEDVEIAIVLNEYQLESIKVGEEEADFTGPIDDQVTFDDGYLDEIFKTEESVTFTFTFTKDDKTVVIDLIVTKEAATS